MNTSTPTRHVPAQPDPEADDAADGAPNPTQLPVEPEFGPLLPPGEPEDPGVGHPHI